MNSSFSDKLADILGFVKQENQGSNTFRTGPIHCLKMGRSSRNCDCLDSINDLVKEEKGFVSVEEFARSLKSVLNFAGVGRLILHENLENWQVQFYM